MSDNFLLLIYERIILKKERIFFLQIVSEINVPDEKFVSL